MSRETLTEQFGSAVELPEAFRAELIGPLVEGIQAYAKPDSNTTTLVLPKIKDHQIMMAVLGEFDDIFGMASTMAKMTEDGASFNIMGFHKRYPIVPIASTETPANE